MFHTDIRKYIQMNKGQLYQELIEARTVNQRNEANFHINYSILLNRLFRELNLTDKITVENEYAVLSGKIDSLYGNFMIEYKFPGRIAETNHSENASFIQQVERYIHGLSEKTGMKANRIAGAVFDGCRVIYIKKRGEEWDVSSPQEMTEDSHALFLMRLLSVNAQGKALTVEHLIEDFGAQTSQSARMITKLYGLLDSNRGRNKPGLLFEQWKILYREGCGYNFEGGHAQLQELRKQYKIETGDMDYAYLVFSIQTYFALLIKLLSIHILAYIKGGSFKEKHVLRIENSESLKRDLTSIEEGGKFRKLGITNFIEGDFFGWYLYLWNDELYMALQELVETFNQYDYSMVILEQESARDILKTLYYELLPSKLRKDLGEFYTPDWLAEFLLDDLKPDISADKTFLDPTCGSGTFVVLLIREYINKYRAEYEDKKLLSTIIQNVKGYDINPLAVISARANYMITLGDLLAEPDTEIEIPVYLCDAMLTILEGFEEKVESYIIPTKADTFLIPKCLIDHQYINQTLNLVNDCLRIGADVGLFETRLKKNLPQAASILSDKERNLLSGLYKKMKDLKDKNLDGIWANVIKNAFAPVFQNKVDYIIGNPPWIDWQNLPEEYRKSIQTYWYKYRIFDHRGQKAQLGSAHDDISVLMTYVIMDNFLKNDGALAFIINQNLLQASGGGDGFRKFLIREEIPVCVKSVHDFVNVEPFRDLGVNNKTAAIVLQKNRKHTYPILYKKWRRRGKKTVDSDASLAEVMANEIYSEDLLAAPIKEYNSPWMIAAPEKRREFDKMLSHDKGMVSYRARKGVDTSANAIFWVKEKRKINQGLIYIDNTPENSRKDIRPVTDYPVETALLYPLLRGKDMKKWRFHTKYSILLPYRKDGRYIEKDKLLIDFPRTYEYFFEESHSFVDILRARATYNKFIKRQDDHAPEYALYNIGSYTFSPYKVVWKALARGVEAVVISEQDKQTVIPDHNLLMVPMEDEEEAYYLSGILNATIVSEFVNAYISWFISAHILDRIHIPKFTRDNSLHRDISELSRKAHRDWNLGEQLLKSIETQLDQAVAALLLKDNP